MARRTGHRFFKDAEFQSLTERALGAAAKRSGEVGEVLATVGSIEDGDGESWFSHWTATAERVRDIAVACEEAGHRVSARDAYLRAAAYFSLATFTLDGTKDPSRLVPTWEAHRGCFDRFGALQDPPVEQVLVPYEGTTLPGYVFKPDASTDPRPWVILNNGSDGPVTAMWEHAEAALERGYNALTFDGPGQNAALFRQQLFFRHDWEAVVTPVVDFVLTRADVDPARVALLGVSQAGYWVPRAVAFEHRIAAAVADPGVWDVGTVWSEKLPKSMRALVDRGDRERFERDVRWAERFSHRMRAQIAFRMRPFGTDSLFDVLVEMRKYRLDDVVDAIECPVLVTDPENEEFWPGQAQQLYDALPEPKAIIRFTAAEGADGHCEGKAPTVRDQRIFDWLDERLRAAASV